MAVGSLLFPLSPVGGDIRLIFCDGALASPPSPPSGLCCDSPSPPQDSFDITEQAGLASFLPPGAVVVVVVAASHKIKATGFNNRLGSNVQWVQFHVWAGTGGG